MTTADKKPGIDKPGFDGEWVKLGDITKIITGKLDANAANANGRYPFFTCAEKALRIDTAAYDCECVLVAGNGDLNVKYYNGPFNAYQRTYIIESNSAADVCVPYLYHFLSYYVATLRAQSIGGVIKYIKLGNLKDARLPLPPLEKQKAVSSIFELIDKSKHECDKQLSNLNDLVKSQFVEMFGDPIANSHDLPLSKWSDVLAIRNGRNQKTVECDGGKFPICGSGGEMGRASSFITKGDSVIIGRKGNINNPILMREAFWNVDTAFGLEPNNKVLTVEYLYNFCKWFDFEKLNKAVTIPSLTKADLLKLDMPLPPLPLQQQFADFVAQVDKLRFDVQQQIERLEILKQSLMQEYFG